MIEKPDKVETEEDWVRVGHYPTLDQANDHGLVILAMGEACQVVETETPGEYGLQAEIEALHPIAGELEAYDREMARPVEWPPSGREWAKHPPGTPWCAAWAFLLIAAFMRQNADTSLVARAASSSIGLIGRGEWWRPFTALFLHADPAHLVGNLLSGWVFATLVSKSIGALQGWALILACGALGNAITSRLTYPEPFVSIGASTAVFAALGILSGLGVAETLHDRARISWIRVSAPALAGVVLLGWLGGGHDPQTDVLGHVFGFGSGWAAGFLKGAFARKPIPCHPGPPHQY